MDSIRSIQKAIDYMEENLLEKISYEDAARHVYMSNYHFHRLFSMLSGMTANEYIRCRRLSMAGHELALSGKKVINVALKYGYESPESFSRAFTRFHGVSPMAARSHKGVLHSFARISVQSILGGNHMVTDLKERGYTVKENGPIYYTNDMDKTIKWFKDILGWYGEIDQRDEKGHGMYGCVLPLPGEIHNMTLVPFNGFHLFYGEPSKRTVAFMQVDSIDNLCSFVKKNGWTQIGEIELQPWGGKECDVTTIDGGVMRFFQLN